MIWDGFPVNPGLKFFLPLEKLGACFQNPKSVWAAECARPRAQPGSIASWR
jgi:hypothetical protein